MCASLPFSVRVCLFVSIPCTHSVSHALQALKRVHPDGLSAKLLNSQEHNPKRHAQEALPCIGKAGDAYLMHPSML